MMQKRNGLSFLLVGLLILSCVFAVGCGSQEAITSGNPAYENQIISIEGAVEGNKEITVAELRKLPQKQFDASYKRTTGKIDKFKVSGPLLNDVLNKLEINLEDYKGIGVTGRDGYYCLISPEILANREIVLGMVIDGQPELEEVERPARLCVQGEFGPYWVKMVQTISLYKEIPKKDITSVWIFKNLADGIEPYGYEYYGSKDDSIELGQVFARLDDVNNKAFFTMKSVDGFVKNEALNMVNERYFIKVEGKDAPTNISPYIKLGMNVKHIAWVSTNADAMVFPKEMEKILETKEINGMNGVTIKDTLREVRVKNVDDKEFEIISVKGQKLKVKGEDLTKGIIVPNEGKTYQVIWEKETGLANIDNLLRIRSVQ